MKKLKIKIVVANYYKEITDPLTQSCTEILEQSKLKYLLSNCKHFYAFSFFGFNAAYFCQNLTDSAHSSFV